MERRVPPTQTRAYVYEGCAPSLSWWRVPLDPVSVRTSGRLEHSNIRISLRYYPYRATFDFEFWFDTTQLPSDSDKVQWVARHVPLSVSVASNVPGHEQVQCLVTDGDANQLVSNMMDI